jgi:hypothetical protein
MPGTSSLSFFLLVFSSIPQISGKNVRNWVLRPSRRGTESLSFWFGSFSSIPQISGKNVRNWVLRPSRREVEALSLSFGLSGPAGWKISDNWLKSGTRSQTVTFLPPESVIP